MRALSLIAALLLVVPACGGASPNQPATTAEALQGPVNPVPVTHAEFAGYLERLLTDGQPSQERNDLLAGVVQHQLKRAAARFKSGHTEAGTRALNGAFYLMRAGELRLDTLSCCTKALLQGATEAARVGNEGRALALYSMLEGLLPEGKSKRDVQSHIEAMREFHGATKSQGRMQATGADQKAAVQRALVDARIEALEGAKDRTIEWMHAALDAADGPIRSSFERDEAVEAYRAVRTGGIVISALYLRHGDPRGALAALEQGDLSRVVPPGLRDRLEAAADDDNPEAWADLFRLVDSAATHDQPETAIDPDLARAAAWGAAVGLFRSEPRSFRGSMPISLMLLELGMAEGAPQLLARTTTKQSSVEEVSWSLSLVLRAIVSEDQSGDIEAARRIFAAAEPMLELARQKPFLGRTRPTAARLQYVMGALETRHGELARARPHLVAAVREEPTHESLSTLAAIDRQRGAKQEALQTLRAIVELAKHHADLTAEGEALLQIFQVQRDLGNTDEAQEALALALNRTLDARELARSDEDQARAERLLARVLEHYDDRDAVRRATQRAYEASASNLDQLTATVIDASRRALTRRDLNAARDAVRQAVEAQLADEDVIYVALWLKLLEKQLNLPSDGTAEEAFATISDASGWPAKLRAWGRGHLDDAALISAARGTAQLTEAKFYAAMAKHATGQQDALPQLKEVAQSTAVDLVEVTIAKDLLAQKQGHAQLKLPSNVDIP